MNNQRFLKCFIALWMLLLVFLGSYYLFLAPRESAYSPDENRTLAGFPEVTAESVFSGRFGEEFESYLLDHFPGRNRIIHLMNGLKSTLSFATHDEYLLIAEGVEDPLDNSDYEDAMAELLAGMESTSPETEPVTESTESTEGPTEPPVTEPPVTEPVEDPPIVPKPETSISDYPARTYVYMDTGDGDVATLVYSREGVAAVTAVLNKFAQLLPENGKLMFTMGPPSYMVRRYVNAEQKVNFYSTWDDVINGLGDDNVFAVDSVEIMGQGIQRGEYVSFRTDNHWTPHGAYLVYNELIRLAGKEPVSYTEDFDITVEEKFRGTYYRDNPSAYWNVEPDTLELLMPEIPVEYRKITGVDTYEVMDFLDFNANSNDRYAVYLGGPGGPWRYIQCENEETENCLVVTDSFGLTIMPFLTGNYNQIHYYDARYFNKYIVGCSVAEMIEKYEIHDIYVIVANFHTFDSGFLMGDANAHLHG